MIEFAFYIDRGGRRSRKNFLVYWEGAPTSFGEFCFTFARVTQLTSCTIAFQYPYVLAFEPTFVEIRNVETGSMSQVIQGNNLRCLFTDTQVYPSSGSSPGPSPGPYAVSAQHLQLLQQTLQHGRGVSGHEEIILVSDDRVLTLRMALPGQ